MATTLTARSPEDLVAAVPCVLGFHPAESVVMLTFGPGPVFHARVDLPGCQEDTPLVVDPLVAAAVTHGVAAVALLAWSDDDAMARHVLGRLSAELAARGIGIIASMRVDDERWYPLGPDAPAGARDGVAYDVSGHRFVAESVLAGRVTHGSREELAATLEPGDPHAAEEVGAAALVAARSAGERRRRAEALWIRATVLRCLDDRTPFTVDEAGRVLVDLIDMDLRDVVLSSMTRESATGHVDLWRDLVRRCPTELLAAPASLLAFAAWLSGQGALAWCAVDRAVLADPGHGLTGLVAGFLERAVPPQTWQPLPDERLVALRAD